MSFNYNEVAKADLEMVYSAQALRIRPKNDKNFGELSYKDGKNQVY
jgi:hypothetical protein